MKNEEDVALANVSCAKADKDNKTRKQVTSKGKRLLSSFAIATLAACHDGSDITVTWSCWQRFFGWVGVLRLLQHAGFSHYLFFGRHWSTMVFSHITWVISSRGGQWLAELWAHMLPALVVGIYTLRIEGKKKELKGPYCGHFLIPYVCFWASKAKQGFLLYKILNVFLLSRSFQF